jgi:tetratricopeptide (TPR) repeat protein
MAERASVSSGTTPPAAKQRGAANYYPIVVGAVAGLSQNTPQARQAVYAHARRVVIERLEASKPPLAKHLIERERLALEQTISKVEAEVRAGGINAAAVRTPTAGARPAVPRRSGRMIRVVAPFGLALFVLIVATTYWLAGGRLNHLSVARPRSQVEQATTARSNDAGRTESAASLKPQGEAQQSAVNEAKGCSPLLAATDLVACANADAERMEARPYPLAGMPNWLPTYGGLREAPAASPPAGATVAATTPSKAHTLTESGKQLAKTGDLERAARDLTEAIRADPLYAEAYVIRGQTMFKLGDAERAIADLNEAVKLDPNNALAIRSRGMAQLYKGDEEAALADLSKAIQLAEADPARMPALELFYAHRSRAALCEKRQLYDREIYDLTAMIDAYWKDPLLAEALRTSYRETGAASLIGSIYRLRANVHVRKGTPELAIPDLSFALQLDQQRALPLLLERGRLHETLGRREQAIIDFQRALEINPANQEAKTALTRLKGQPS